MKKFVFLINFLFGFLGLASILLAFSSLMLFDSPGSENNTYVWVLFWSSISLPFTCFGSVITSLFIMYKSRQYKKALWPFLLPCLVIAIMAVSLTLIQIYCGGNFSCPQKHVGHNLL